MFPTTSTLPLPVSINEAGIDVIGSFQASDWLQTDARGLVGHDVDQSILELVAGKVGTDEARSVGFGVGQTLEGWMERRKGGMHRERKRESEFKKIQIKKMFHRKCAIKSTEEEEDEKKMKRKQSGE